MFIQQLSHNRRNQAAAGAAGLALAGMSALAVISFGGSTASLAAPTSRAHRVAAGAAAARPIVAEGATAATIAGTSTWAGSTARWLVRNHYGVSFAGSALQAAMTSAGFESTAATGNAAPSVQCSMSSHTSMRNGSVLSVCLNPQVTVPSLSGTVQRVRSISHVGVTLPYYSPGRAPSATAPSAKVGTLPSAQTGHNEVTLNLGSRPSVTPGSVDAGTVGQVNAPHITIN